MDISPVIFWNIVLTLVIAPAFWAFRSLITEIKRIDILLNKTREEYATRDELRDDMRQVMDALHRVEDKLDKALGKVSNMAERDFDSDEIAAGLPQFHQKLREETGYTGQFKAEPLEVVDLKRTCLQTLGCKVR